MKQNDVDIIIGSLYEIHSRLEEIVFTESNPIPIFKSRSDILSRYSFVREQLKSEMRAGSVPSYQMGDQEFLTSLRL